MLGTLRIFYNRWAEVLLVIVFSGGALLLFNEFGKRENISEGATMLMGLGTGFFVIFGYLMQLGFLRTAYVEGEMRQEPKTLIITGARFLWRVILVAILIGILIFMISQLIFIFVYSKYGSIDGGKIAAEDVPAWMMYVSVYGAMTLLIKPIVLVPAIIVAFDCRVKDVLRHLRVLKIFKAGEVWGWILLMVIFNTGLYGVEKMFGFEKHDNILFNGAMIFVSALVGLGMHMGAVNYIKNQTLIINPDVSGEESADGG